MRKLLVALLVAAFGAPLWAEEAAYPPFFGVEPLDSAAAADRDAARMERLAGLGPALVRTAPIDWGSLQPAAGSVKATGPGWQSLDESILVWQLSGFDPVPVLTPRSPWAAQAPEKSDWHRAVRAALPAVRADAALRGTRGATPPSDAHWTAWEQFVRAFVERYDGDGQDDMPGLRRPIRYVQILERVGTPDAWLGGGAAYLRLLHHAGLGAKSAHAETRLVTAAIDLRGTGHAPLPDPREWDYRIGLLSHPSSPLAALEVKRSFELARALLEMPRLYDVLVHAGSEHHADDVANLAFVRHRLDEGGGRTVAVWLADNPTRKLGQAHVPGAVAPRTEEARLRNRWLAPALNRAHSEHAKASAWLRRGQAIDLVRSLCRARAAGADVVFALAPWDALPAGHHRRSTAAMQGLVARPLLALPSEPLVRTPSWYALQQAGRLLGGHRSAGDSPLGAPGQAIVFSFRDDPKRPWITVLLLDERLSWAGAPGEPLPQREVTVPLPNGEYVLEPCRLGKAEPERRVVRVTAGMLTLRLSPAPLYVIPKR